MLYFIPTKVYCEKDCVRKHGKELSSYGEKAMIVTGASSSKVNGSLRDVQTVLTKENISYIVFDEIEENPSIETVMKARDIGVKEEVDFIIGVGGGSPMDAAKAIALMVKNPTETGKILYETKPLSYLPVVCVPTTCGTGSEVTPYAILTVHEHRMKKGMTHRIFPELALLDWTYLRCMSREGLISTAVDALAHLIESYLNVNANQWNRTFSREGLAVWAQFKEGLKNAQLLEEDYEKMLRASTLAGMAIAHTGTSLPHGLSYTLTYELGIPHGRAAGLYLAGFVARYQNKEDTDAVLDLLGFEDSIKFQEYMRVLLGHTEVDEWILRMGAQNILADARKMKNYPFAITEQEMLDMFQ